MEQKNNKRGVAIVYKVECKFWSDMEEKINDILVAYEKNCISYSEMKQQLLNLHSVSQQRELLIDFYSKQNGGMNETNKDAIIREVNNYIESINCS